MEQVLQSLGDLESPRPVALPHVPAEMNPRHPALTQTTARASRSSSSSSDPPLKSTGLPAPRRRPGPRASAGPPRPSRRARPRASGSTPVWTRSRGSPPAARAWARCSDDRRSHLHGEAGRGLDRVARVGSALPVNVLASRVGPDDERDPQALALRAHAGELREVIGLARGTVVERVPDGHGPEADGFLDGARHGGERPGLARDPGLPVQLHNERDAALEPRPVALGDAVMDDEAREPSVPGKVEDVVRVSASDCASKWRQSCSTNWS